MGLLDSLGGKGKASVKVEKILQECDSLFSNHNLTQEMKDLGEAYEILRTNYQQMVQENHDELARIYDDLGSKYMYHLQRYDFAVTIFDVGLTLAPNNIELLTHKAIALLNMEQNLNEALAIINRVIEILPSMVNWDLKGDICAKLNMKSEAVKAYINAQNYDNLTTKFIDKAFTVDPDNIELSTFKIRRLMSAGQVDDALNIVVGMINRFPQTPYLWILKTEVDILKNNLTIALASIDKAISIVPDNPEYFVIKGNIYFKKKDWEDALNNYNLALAKDPNHIKALLGKASALAMLNKVSDLIEVRRRISAVDPANIENWKERMFLSRSMGLDDEARICANYILKKDPSDKDALNLLNEIGTVVGSGKENIAVPANSGEQELSAEEQELLTLKEGGKRDEAIDLAKKIIAKNPNNKIALLELGRFYTLTGNIDIGISYFDRYTKLYPEDINVALERVTILTTANRYDDAIHALSSILLKKESGDLWLMLGEIYENYAETKEKDVQSSLYKQAEEAFDKGLRLYGPSVPTLLEAKGNLYLRTNKYSDALSVFELLTSTSPTNLAGLEGMAKSFYGLGNFVKASELVDRSLQLNPTSADLWILKGRINEQLSNFDEALASYNEAFANQKDVHIMELIVQLLLKQKKYDEMLVWNDRILENKKDYTIYVRKGDVLVTLGRLPEAINAYKEALNLNNELGDIKVKLANTLYMSGDMVNASEYLKAVLNVDPDNRSVAMLYINTLIAQGKHDEALPVVERLISDDNKNVELLQLKLVILKKLNRMDEYRKTIDYMISENIYDSTVLLDKAEELLKKNRTEEVIDLMNRLRKIDSNNVSALVMIGKSYLQEGKYNDAIAMADQILSTGNKNVDGWTIKILSLVKLEKMDEAMNLINNNLAADPQSIPLLVLGGDVLSSKGRRDEAEIYYRRAIEVNPKENSALIGLAKLKIQANNLKGAKELINKALDIRKDLPEVWYLLATVNEQLGIPEEAINNLKNMIALENGEEGYERLADAYKSIGNFQEAEKYYEIALKHFPEKIDLDLNRGECLERLKRFDEAIACYDKVISKNSTDKYVWNTKGLLLLQMKKYDDASTCFQKALELDPRFQSAIEGKRVCDEKIIENSIDGYAKKVLNTEFKSGKPLTKQEIFLHCGVPFNMLDKVVSYIISIDKINVLALNEEEQKNLEDLSLELVKFYVNKGAFLDPRNITLSDITGYLPRLSTNDSKRLLGYIKGVMDLDPQLIPIFDGIDDLLRETLSLPKDKRNVITLSVLYSIGILKARALEKGLKSFDSGLPETMPNQNFHAVEEMVAAPPPEARPPPVLLESEDVKQEAVPDTSSSSSNTGSANSSNPPGTELRCAVCGGVATLVHDCGTPLCDHCVSIYGGNCPKCGLPVVKQAYSTPPTKGRKRKKEPLIIKASPGIVSTADNITDKEKGKK